MLASTETVGELMDLWLLNKREVWGFHQGWI